MSNEYVYVAVDETGNLGKSLKGERYYTLVACVVNDQKTFEDATRRLKHIEEVKFYTNPELREKVLEYAAPTISTVFYVAYPKKKGRSMDRYEQAELHLKMVQSLADAIILRYGYLNDLVVEIDHKDGISDRMVSDIFRMNEYKVKRIISNVVDSRNSYGLQTNDFIVGAIGVMLNRSNYDYVRLLEKEPQPSYIRSENKKAERDLLPPYGRVQAHTDIPYETGKPSEFPMRSESERKERHQSFPMVSYITQRLKKDINLSKEQGEPHKKIIFRRLKK